MPTVKKPAPPPLAASGHHALLAAPTGRRSYNRLFAIACLTIVPTLLGLTVLYVLSITEPYWLGNNSDPAYAYLLNSLMLTQGFAPAHIDHPGGPLKILGSIVILVTDLFRGAPPLVLDVIANPEIYAKTIQSVTAGLIVGGFLSIGFFCHRVTGSLVFAVLVQLTPFFSPQMLRLTGRYGPDGFLILCGMLLAIMIVLSVRMNKPLKPYWLALGFSLVMGFGGASKFLFLPLGLIPLILIPTLRWKIAYVFGTVGSFFLFTSPMATYYSRMSSWITNLLTHSGQYGSGSTGVIDVSAYTDNITKIFRLEPSLLYVTIITFSLCLFMIAFRITKTNLKARRYEWCLYALFLTQLIFVSILAKSPTGPYLVTLASLNGLTLGIVWLSLRRAWIWNRYVRRLLLGGVVVFVGIILHRGVVNSIVLASNLETLQAETLAPGRYIENNFANCALVHVYRSSHMIGALFLGDDFSKGQFKEALSTFYPNSYSYSRKSSTFRNWHGQVSFSEITRTNDCVIVLGSPFRNGDGTEIPGFIYEDVYGGTVETIYLLHER